jgi:methylated-DNA-[protein]-cysteine S-methyltransferase
MRQATHAIQADTCLGELTITTAPAGLLSVRFDAPRPDLPQDALCREALAQLQAYLAGRLERFALPLAAEGSVFQQRVWAALTALEFGHTTSYGALAAGLGQPSAARAVGAAVGRNPLWIVVPCHRVLGRGGTLTGYAGGLARKRALLALEGFHAAH